MGSCQDSYGCIIYVGLTFEGRLDFQSSAEKGQGYKKMQLAH